MIGSEPAGLLRVTVGERDGWCLLHLSGNWSSRPPIGSAGTWTMHWQPGTRASR